MSFIWVQYRTLKKKNPKCREKIPIEKAFISVREIVRGIKGINLYVII